MLQKKKQPNQKPKTTKPETKNIINFSHNWDKLQARVFPTIRGISTFQKYRKKKGYNFDITLKREFYCKAKLISIKTAKISELPLEFLQKDARSSRDNIRIDSHQSFVNLMNSFRSTMRFAPYVDLDSEVTILWFFKTEKVSHKTARDLSQLIVDQLHMTCERIEVAGSIRRGKNTVKDIELIAVPKIHEYKVPGKLDNILATESKSITKTSNRLKKKLVSLEKQSMIRLIKMGDRYCQFLFLDLIIVDLFVASWLNYGVIKMIRTGPAQYSTKFMVELNTQGEYQIQDGHLWQIDENDEITTMVPIGTEDALYQEVGFPYIAPHDRKDEIFYSDPCAKCGRIDKFGLQKLESEWVCSGCYNEA